MSKKHGQSKTRLYGIYNGMKQRCNNPKSQSYQYYGAKGIKVCDEWKNDFMAFKEWADANGYNDTLTIDRIDPKKDYCPENCRWLTINENASLAKYSRTKESYKKALAGSIKYYKKQDEIRVASKRINELDKIMKELPDLNDMQLNLVFQHIQWIKAQESANKRMNDTQE